MQKFETELPGVYIIEPKVIEDERGWFSEIYSDKAFTGLGFNYNFVQDNESFTARKGTLRGLHFQKEPMSQAKLLRVLVGAVLDVAVDIRANSPHYKKWVSVKLSAKNKRMLMIPRGFAHGFLTLTDNVHFAYKVDNYYSPELDRSIRFDDPTIGVDWGIDNPIMSKKDLNAPFLDDCDV